MVEPSVLVWEETDAVGGEKEGVVDDDGLGLNLANQHLHKNHYPESYAPKINCLPYHLKTIDPDHTPKQKSLE